MIAREGRAVVFAVNKWDLIEKRAGAIGKLRERLDRLLPQISGAPLVAVSALSGEAWTGCCRPCSPPTGAGIRAFHARRSTAS